MTKSDPFRVAVLLTVAFLAYWRGWRRGHRQGRDVREALATELMREMSSDD